MNMVPRRDVVCENYLPVVALNDSGSAIVQVPSVVKAQVGIHFKEPKRELELSRLLYKLHLFRLANLLGLGLFSVMTVRTIKSSPVAKKTLVKRAYRAASAIKSKSAMAKKAARKSK
jgi:hypothetical protein